ncbi:MAG TPA: hypothetical protein VJN96_12090 [Vicinamibacterales bacterium]|nr:hypothetical protein [Vicinamibacterales bacterium]
MLWTLAHAAATWTAWYSDSPVLRTTLNFAHIAGLVGGGGAAIVEDRAMLAALSQNDEMRLRRVEAQRLAHRVVLTGLAVAVLSGLLLFAADWDTYLYSKVFWSKMVLVALLVANGVMLTRAEHAARARQPNAWSRLRRGAIVSLVLWSLTTLAGAALPNVG